MESVKNETYDLSNTLYLPLFLTVNKYFPLSNCKAIVKTPESISILWERDFYIYACMDVCRRKNMLYPLDLTKRQIHDWSLNALYSEIKH